MIVLPRNLDPAIAHCRIPRVASIPKFLRREFRTTRMLGIVVPGIRVTVKTQADCVICIVSSTFRYMYDVMNFNLTPL